MHSVQSASHLSQLVPSSDFTYYGSGHYSTHLSANKYLSGMQLKQLSALEQV